MSNKGIKLEMLLLMVVLAAVSSTSSARSHSRPVRQYSGYTDVGYRSGQSGHGHGHTQQHDVKACLDIHEIANGQSVCAFSGCRLRCLPGYSFPSTGRKRVMISCDHKTGDMKFNEQIWQPDMTVCQPTCEKTCQNGGLCVGPNKCDCSGPYTGDDCSEEAMLGDQPYKGYRPEPLSANQRRIECNPGTRMPDGSTSVTVTYRDNDWWFPDGSIMLGVDQVTCGIGLTKAPTPTQKPVQKPVHRPDPLKQSTPDQLFVNQRHIECGPHTRMPDGSTSVTLTFRDGNWWFPNGDVVLGVDQVTCSEAKTNTAEHVAPETVYVTKPKPDEIIKTTPRPREYQCNPPCENGGTCVHTNACSCPRGFWGRTCKSDTCTYPRFTTNLNTSLSGTLKRLKFECHPRHHTRRGEDLVVVECVNGIWRLASGRLLSEQDVKCFPESP